MARTLSPEVIDQLKGQFGILPVVLFQLQDRQAAYYNGPRPLTWNGVEYLPTKFLEVEPLAETLEDETAELTITFSGIPEEGQTLAERLSELHYSGAPVTISRLVVNIDTDEIVGVAQTSFHEVYDVLLEQEDDGESEIISKIEIVVRSPGFIGRRQTNTLRSEVEHKADFAADDTFYKDATEVVTVQREWGQRSG